MRVRRPVLTLIVAAALALPLAHARDDAPPAPPMAVDVYVRGERRDQKVSGRLLAHDEAKVTLALPGGATRELTWDQLTPSSAFTLRGRLIDKASAADWLALGNWGWLRGLEAQARSAFAEARRRDASLGAAIDATLATKSGTYKPATAAAAPTTAPAAVASTPATRPAGEADDSPADVADATAMQPGLAEDDAEEALVVYATPTAAEVQAALDATRRDAAKARAKLKLELAEVETAHFLIYTDWDPREYGFLKEHCEGAYRAVAKQFAQPAGGNMFLGKLPVYMFKAQSDFQSFARKLDGFAAPATVLGYFKSTRQMGHMAMWKPGIGATLGGGGGSKALAERRWARTLIHEFCHAFIHRYKSNARVPRWLNEGTAELISEGELPTNNYRAPARAAAVQGTDVMPLFDDDQMPGGYFYPSMMSMAELLARQEPKAFVGLFDDIKAGVEPEAALRKRYGVDYKAFAEKWRAWAVKL